MQLSEFTYIFLTLCIPFLIYIVRSTNPKKGFSILFISIISTVIFLNFSLLTVLGTLLLIATLMIKNKKIYPYFYGLSFTLLNFEIFNTLNLNIFDFFLNYLFPISLVSGVFSSMMIGHWFLVDPTISKEGMKKIAITSTFQSLILTPLVFFEFIGQDIENIFKNVILILFLSTSILSFASYKSLGEKSYTGVMASTGLSYLSLIVSLGASGGLLLLS